MKPRTLLILALLVVGLGAFVWFYERQLPSSDERAELVKRVLRVEPEEVERLEIDWDEGGVELVREGVEAESEEATASASGWQLASPYDARADATAVDGLLGRLTGLEKERTLEEVDRQEAGLASPRATVRLVTEEGEHVLRIGAEVPASSNMLVEVDGRDETYVVPASIWSDLTKEPGAWRDKKLFAGQRGDIERLTIRHGDERILLARRGESFWVEAPLVDRADQSRVDSLLATLTGLRAESFVDEPPEDLAAIGLAPPRAVLEVVLDGREAPLVFEVGAVKESVESEEEESPTPPSEPGDGSTAPTLYLRTASQIVTTQAKLAEPLDRTAAEWRSRQLAAMEVYEIDRAEVEAADGTLELERDGGEWLRDGEKIVYGPATDFLYELTGAEAERLAEPGEPEAGPARLTVRLVADADGEEGEPTIETLTLHQPVGGETPATTSGREAVLMLSAETVAAIDQELTALRSADLAPDEGPSEDSAEEAATASAEADG